MKLTNPTNSKHIIVGANEELVVRLEDFDTGSREFTLEVILKGNNASCEVQGRVQAMKQDVKTWNVVMKFEGANQTGIIELHGTAEDDAQLELNGTGIIPCCGLQIRLPRFDSGLSLHYDFVSGSNC